jgi:toxin-antitoxin system PIN domain toxin
MKPYLLDINVLIALAWRNHVHHEDVQRWFARKGAAGFRTCPTNQTGFVGISSNPAFTPQPVTAGEALDLLDRITHLSGHEFWFDDLPLRNAVAPGTLLGGHRQVTDVYLLALASAHGGVLATLDRGVAALARGGQLAVELIG